MKDKAFYLFTGFLISIIVFLYFDRKAQRKDFEIELASMEQKLIKEYNNNLVKLEKKQDSIRANNFKELESLVKNVSTLNEKTKDYEKRPSFDIDFISAFDIIAKSHYRPD